MAISSLTLLFMYFGIVCLNFLTVFVLIIYSYIQNPEKRGKLTLNLVNWLLLFLPNLYFMNYDFMVNRNLSLLNVLIVSVCHFIVWNVLFEIIFYLGHRFLHENKFLYQHIHKMHHIDIPSSVLDAQWVHPLETMLIIIPAYWCWPYLADYIWPNCLTYQVLSVMSIMSSLENIRSHTFRDKSGFHFKHHEKWNYNFGTIGFLDYIFQTII